MTLLTGAVVGLPGFSLPLLFRCGMQVIAAAFATYLVCTPMVLIFGRIHGAYLAGSIVTFFLGYSMLFFKRGILLSVYPFSAALILTGFDMTEYNGAVSPPNHLLALAGIGSVLLVTGLLLALSGRQKEIMPQRSKKAKGRGKRGRAASRQSL